MSTINHNDELIEFADEAVPGEGEGACEEAARAPAWKILVVDDDEEVHQATAFALRGARILDRPLELVPARSGGEARRQLAQRGREFAVVLLDVVMETPDAGLQLVPWMRGELGLGEVRIVLRTGQPGYAPELSVVRDFDINDYRTKSELTHVRLVTTLTAAIRSYDQIRTISASRRGLDLIVRSASELFGRRALSSFAEGVLTQIAALLRLEPDGLLCAQNGSPFAPEPDGSLYVVGAAGRYRDQVSQPLAGLADRAIVDLVDRCLAARASIYQRDATALYFASQSGRAAIVYLATDRELDATDRRLLEVFAVNIGVGFDNVGLFERLNFHAYFDPLTRLPNRVRFVEETDARLNARGDAHGSVLALLDVARFSEINNALGQRTGDALLVAIARRLRSVFAEPVLVARVVGDNFALFGRAEALRPERLIRTFDAPFYARGHGVPLQVRVGLAEVLCSPAGQLPRAADLLRDASVALGRAKRDPGSRHCLYSRRMADEARERVAMLNELRAALDVRRGLLLHYQPQVDPREGRVLGCEALIRWRKEAGEMVPPDGFIPLAEYTGLIVEIGAWVFREACEQLVRWRSLGLTELSMAVNVSALQFRRDGFVTMIRGALEASGAPAERIELEITESVALEDVDKVVAQLRELRLLGIRIALDDFGCGFSSLGSLARLPIDRVKIDRSFVRELSPENARRGIADTIVQLAQGMAMEVIAEGVETEQQATLLHELGCRSMQGFLYGRPMPAEAFVEWAAAYPAAH